MNIATKAIDLLVDRHTRSFIFLLFTILIIFAINSLLPIIEGNTHHTVHAVEMTYKEYKELNSIDEHNVLTWTSEQDVENYINSYRSEHPDTVNTVVEPYPEFKVKVYTRFFFEHPYWYISTLTSTVSAILLFYSIFNYILTRQKDSYKRYVDLNNEMVTLSNNSLDPSTFEPWMLDKFNRDRKIKQHISNTKYRLSKLNSRTKYTIRTKAEEGCTDKKCVRYLHKKQDLESQLTEDYINSVVVHKHVKHFRFIQPMFVQCGVNKVGHTVDNYSLIESDGKRLGKDVVYRITSSMTLTVMFASLLTVTVAGVADKPWYWIIIDVLTKIAPLIMQVPAAYDYCNMYMEDHLITNLLNRRSIALSYLADIQKGV